MSTCPNSPLCRVSAFVLGLAGFFLFAVLAVFLVNRYQDNGTGYENARAAARQKWSADSQAAQAALHATAWKDQAAGLVQVKAADYLPLAAKALLTPDYAPKAAQGDKFVVPGTPTADAIATKQAETAAFPAPDAAAPAPAPTAPAPAPVDPVPAPAEPAPAPNN